MAGFAGLTPTASLIALIVIIIVAVLIIIEASWSLWLVNTVKTNDICECSGVSSSSIGSLRAYEIVMLIIGLGLLVYAIVLLIIPTPEKRKATFASTGRRFERASAQQSANPKSA